MKKALIITGGQWHDCAGYAEWAKPHLEELKYSVEIIDRTTVVTDALLKEYSHTIIYTCFSNHDQAPTPPVRQFSPEEVGALKKWTEAGGGLLPMHAATVVSTPDPDYTALVGGEFLSHPPQCAFELLPFGQPHPVIESVSAATLFDEMYIEKPGPDILVHAVSIFEGHAWPAVWTRAEGKGRVCHLASGHHLQVWELPAYVRLFTNAVAWVSQ